MTHIDSFGSRYDSPVSIGELPEMYESVGYELIGELSEMATSVGYEIIGELPEMYESVGYEIIGCSVDDAVGNVFNAAIGFSASGAMSSASGFANKASGALNQVNAKAQAGSGAKNTAADIRNITRSPVTHLALAATATVVPFGSVVAGVAEIGMGALEIAAVAIENFDFIANGVHDVTHALGIDCIFGCAPPKPPVNTKAQARARAKAVAKLNRQIEAKAMLIATTMVAAKAGDRKAQERLIAIQMAENVNMKHAKALTKTLAHGFNPVAAASIMGALEASNKHAVKGSLPWIDARVKDRVKVLLKTLPVPHVAHPKPAPKMSKVKATIDAGAKVLAKAAVKKAKERGPMAGILVTAGGKLQKGKFHNNLPSAKVGSHGWMVMQSGKVIAGRWSLG